MLEDGLIWRTLPDTGRAAVFLGPAGAPIVQWSNCIVLPPRLLARLVSDADEYWFDPQDRMDAFANRWIVNTAADIDEYDAALAALDDSLGQRCPIWNHPRAVALTRRDLAPEVFGGIEGLEVPKVARVAVTHPGAFREVFARERFRFPVLVRPVASQTGVGLVRIDSDGDFSRLEHFSNLGRVFFMTQFVDFRNAEGHHVKVRVCFVDGTISLREYGVSRGWQIGSGGSTSPAGQGAIRQAIDLLLDRMAGFETWTALREICGQMIARCPLNFWGADLGVRSDRSFVFFEANAAMTMAVPTNVPPALLPRMAPVYRDIEVRLGDSIDRLRGGRTMPVPSRSVRDLAARVR